MPLFSLGPYSFTFSGTVSGNAPKKIQGPDRSMYVVEHIIPSREGGITEYVGSEQSKYKIQGFIAPPDVGPFNGTAAAVLSGTSYVTLNADDALAFLFNLRGSGAQLLKMESTNSKASGYMNLYDQGFFFMDKMTLAYEAGRTYPYYPYTIDLRGFSPKTYGDNSGVSFLPSASGNYLSGYINFWLLRSGLPLGETINTLGVYVKAVASGNARLAIANSGGVVQAQSTSQAVHSGWNYFPISPSFATTSGTAYIMALMGDATSTSGYTLQSDDTGTTSGVNSLQSGITYSNGFPATIAAGTLANVSGDLVNVVMVAGK